MEGDFFALYGNAFYMSIGVNLVRRSGSRQIKIFSEFQGLLAKLFKLIMLIYGFVSARVSINRLILVTFVNVKMQLKFTFLARN